MNNKYTKKLKERIKELEQTNKVLIDENKSLKDTINRIDYMQDKYEKGLKEIKELKDKYKNLISETVKEKKHFTNEVLKLIKKIKKQK